MRFQKLIKLVLLVYLTAAVGASLVSCKRSNGQPSNSGAANPTPTILEVSTVAAVVRQLPRFFEATGTLAADVQTDVQPQTAGKVVAVGVDMGSAVSKGQMLVRLEEADYKLRVDQAVAHFHLGYGDLATDVRSKPFSHFEFNAELSDKASQGERGRLSLLTARGTLGGIELHHGSTARHTLGALLTYEYYNNPAFEYGGQSVYGGLISEFHKADDKDDKKVRATTEVLLQGIIIGATLSEHYYAGEGRNYDYGMGLGTRLAATLVKPARGAIRVGWGGRWLHTLNGAQSAHYQGGGFFEARFFLTSKFGLGASYYNYHRKTDYTGFPTVTQTSPMLNFFLTTAMPSLTP